MFLTNTVNIQSKSLFEYNVELCEDIISFNEEYNNIKESIILQEHSMLLEGNTLDYIQESIGETASKIWEHIKRFLIKLKNKIVEVYNIVKKKVLEIIVKLKSFFTKGEDIIVIDIKEDVSKLQRLRAYISNIGKVTKENIMEHKKEIAAIVGMVTYVTYILWRSSKGGDDNTKVKVSKEVDGKSGLSERETELNVVNLDQSAITRFAEGLFKAAEQSSKSNNNEEADKIKAEVTMLAYLQAEEQKLKMNILRSAAYMKGLRGKENLNEPEFGENGRVKSGLNTDLYNSHEAGKSYRNSTFRDRPEQEARDTLASHMKYTKKNNYYN